MSLSHNAFWQPCSWLQIGHLLRAMSDSIMQCLDVHRFAAGGTLVEHHCLVCVNLAVTLQVHDILLELLWSCCMAYTCTHIYTCMWHTHVHTRTANCPESKDQIEPYILVSTIHLPHNATLKLSSRNGCLPSCLEPCSQWTRCKSAWTDACITLISRYITHTLTSLPKYRSGRC